MEARFSLKQFLIAVLVFLPIVMVGIVGFTAHETIRLLTKDVSHRNLLLAQAVAGQVDSLLERSRDLLAEIENDIFVLKLVKRSRLDGYLKSKVLHNPGYFDQILILNRRGLVTHAAPRASQYRYSDFSRHPVFLRAWRSKDPYWSPSFVSARSGRPSISISLPHKKGVLVGYLNLQNLRSIIKHLDLGPDGYAAIVDKRSVPLAHSQNSLVAQQVNLRDLPVVALGLKGRQGTLTFEREGQLWLGSTASVKETGWLVVMVQSQAEAFSQVRWITRLTWAGIVALGLLVLGAGLWGFRKVEPPLATLVANTRRVASGDYHFPAPQGLFREVAELSSAFQAMIEAVRSREQELRESRENLRALVESSNDAIITLDSERRITSCNAAFLQLFGFTRQEALGQSIALIHTSPQSHRSFGETVYPIVQRKGSWRGEWKYRRKNGDEIYTESAIASLRLPGGGIGGYVAIMRDITERKRAQDALRESRELYRTLVEESFDGIFVQKGSKIVFANSRLREMLGYAEGEMEGMDHWLVYHPDYHELTRRRAQARMRGEDVPSRYEVKLQRKDGSSFEAELIAHPIIFEGESGVQVCLRDITERKRAQDALSENERRLQAILQANPDPVVVYDEKGGTTFVNPAFTRVFGWTLEELEGGRIPFVPLEEQEKTFATIERLFLNGKPVNLETRRLTKDGEVREVFISAASIRDQGGRATGMVVNLTDITDRKRLEAQLQQAQKMEAIGTLAGGIAHDFNNILTAIAGYTELALYKTRTGEEVTAELEQALKTAGRATELVKRILTFSRRVETERKPLNLNLEVIQTVKMLERTIPKMISIELQLADDLRLIEGDSGQLEQVLMNLGTNARDAMPEGGRLIIETQNVLLDQDYTDRHLGSTPGDYVLLTFSDTGQGMDSETLRHIFDPFFTTKGVGEGTGLGLAMVYGIVKNHGGHIIAYSQPGQGTAFKLYFPALQGETRHEGGERKPLVQTQGGHESILLVDDEKAILEIGQSFLESFGYRVMTATSGEEALRLYQDKQPDVDLIILDLGMPGMGGKKCLTELLNIDPGVKVIIASGYSAQGLVAETLAAGALEFISKPYRLAQMLEKIRIVLDG